MDSEDPTLGTLIAIIAISAGLPSSMVTPSLPEAFPIHIRGIGSIEHSDRRFPVPSSKPLSDTEICISAEQRASSDYESGTAVLFGLATRSDARPGDLDPKYRCRIAGMGCEEFAGGGRWIDCYNRAVRDLIATKGPMNGSYLGPYPTNKEAIRALQRSRQRMTRADLVANQTFVSGRTISLSPKVYGAVCSGPTDPGDKYIVALFKETCLVVGTPWFDQFWVIRVIDPASGILVARFIGPNPIDTSEATLNRKLYGL